MYLVKIGTSPEIFHIHFFFQPTATPAVGQNIRTDPALFSPDSRKNRVKASLYPFQIHLRRLYTKWQEKFSLWRLCCVTPTSL